MDDSEGRLAQKPEAKPQRETYVMTRACVMEETKLNRETYALLRQVRQLLILYKVETLVHKPVSRVVLLLQKRETYALLR